MTTPTLASALRAKQKEMKLSIAAMAQAIGANAQSVTAALKGASIPNATTAPKYAAFLGLSPEQFAALAKPAKAVKAAKPVKAAKAAKPEKAAKVPKPQQAKPEPTAKRAVRGGGAVTLAEAVELSADALAVATHRATAAQRRVVAALLGA